VRRWPAPRASPTIQNVSHVAEILAYFLMARMFNPPHPGLTLKEDVLPALGLSIAEAARQLGVSRTALSRIVNGHAAISPDMACRLEAWLGVERGGRAELWLRQQIAYDLWQLQQRPRPQVIPAPALVG
jgi:addiction module HigA family antidote